ncbi:MAG: sigma-70 family RNA polymerase sigma factor [Burkholderiales bacterium]|nr:MAG: sigma-70 family RNA polymerase sigma factor [Burkholderiales bacterium]
MPRGADLAAHRSALLRFARRRIRDEALAEDAVQDALLAGMAGIDRFQGQSALRTWLIGILNHKIQDVFRREGRYLPLESRGQARDLADGIQHWPADPAHRPEPDDPLGNVQSARMRDELEREIDALPPTLKEVFRMQVLEGASTAEVCSRLGISEANCWVRLHRARRRLAQRMAAHL